MGNIVLLDDLTINQIAAGEVIERPASVIKEMLENSIDAGAKNITIEVKNGGISLIRITDDGCGIAEDDMEIAFERHATSKIRKAEDLQTVKSMGFRGEALASIAAISKVEMVSKKANSSVGNKIVLEGGEVLEKTETGCPNGTKITVENLFYNTPVRYKFLKKDYTEAGYIEDVVTRTALVNKNVAITLINNGKTIIHTPGNGNMKSIIYSVYGKDIANSIVDVDYMYEDIRVTGVIGKPEIAKATRANQLFFVNNRFVKDKTLTSAADKAYKDVLAFGKFGFLVLNLEIDPKKVDVNVHPAKLEVRFQDESTVFKSVYHAIKVGLGLGNAKLNSDENDSENKEKSDELKEKEENEIYNNENNTTNTNLNNTNSITNDSSNNENTIANDSSNNENYTKPSFLKEKSETSSRIESIFAKYNINMSEIPEVKHNASEYLAKYYANRDAEKAKRYNKEIEEQAKKIEDRVKAEIQQKAEMQVQSETKEKDETQGKIENQVKDEMQVQSEAKVEDDVQTNIKQESKITQIQEEYQENLQAQTQESKTETQENKTENQDENVESEVKQETAELENKNEENKIRQTENIISDLNIFNQVKEDKYKEKEIKKSEEKTGLGSFIKKIINKKNDDDTSSNKENWTDIDDKDLSKPINVINSELKEKLGITKNFEVNEQTDTLEKSKTMIIENISDAKSENNNSNINDETIKISEKISAKDGFTVPKITTKPVKELAENSEQSITEKLLEQKLNGNLQDTQLIDTVKVRDSLNNLQESKEFEEMYKKTFGVETLSVRKEKEQEEEEINASNEFNYPNVENESVFENEEYEEKVNYKFVGIIFDANIIIEISNEMFIINQNTAQERLIYEKVKENYNREEKDTQVLLLPDIISLNHKELFTAKQNIQLFEKAGFEFEEFGENTIKLISVPSMCEKLNTKQLFLEILRAVDTVAINSKKEKEDKFISVIAAKCAEKIVPTTDETEIDEILQKLLKLENPFICSNGKIVAIKMTRYDLEKKFSRR
jgi:DNA mismatch repair protein MutL